MTDQRVDGTNLQLLAGLDTYVEKVVRKIPEWAEERQHLLRPATDVALGLNPARFVFICTHNSRRSQFAQVWATVASRYFGLGPIEAYSGGTEVTACNPKTIAALERAGFAVREQGDRDNPVFSVAFDEKHLPVELYSKEIHAAPNPKEDFVAMMCCSEADEFCPVVSGALARISLHYVDPKESDGSPLERATYDLRCFEIAIEMFAWMKDIRSRIRTL